MQYDPVVLDLAVLGPAGVGQPGLAAEAEPGETDPVAGRGRNVQLQQVLARLKRRVRENLLARIGPVPVAVVVHPRVQVPIGRGNDLQRIATIRLQTVMMV